MHRLNALKLKLDLIYKLFYTDSNNKFKNYFLIYYLGKKRTTEGRMTYLFRNVHSVRPYKDF